MAYTKAQLETQNNTLLASGQADKISAVKHRAVNQAIIDEMFDAQTRANLLAAVEAALSTATGDKVLLIRSGVAKLVDISLIESGTITDGQGTTANGTAVDLGGAFTAPISILGDVSTGFDALKVENTNDSLGAGNEIITTVNITPIQSLLRTQNNGVTARSSDCRVQIGNAITIESYHNTNNNNVGIVIDAFEDGFIVYDNRTVKTGIEYENVPDAPTAKTLIHKGYADTKLSIVNSAGALTDAGTIDLTAAKHTLTSSSATRTFTISYTGDDIVIEVTLNTTAATYTFPAGSLCVSEGAASGNNTLGLSGVSGDKYIITTKKIGSVYYVVSKNFGQ